MSLLFDDPDDLREIVIDELAQHSDTMRRTWSDNDTEPATVELGCKCGFVRGTVTAQEMAADLPGWLRKHREHVAEELIRTLRAQEAAAIEDSELDAYEDMIRRGEVQP